MATFSILNSLNIISYFVYAKYKLRVIYPDNELDLNNIYTEYFLNNYSVQKLYSKFNENLIQDQINSIERFIQSRNDNLRKNVQNKDIIIRSSNKYVLLSNSNTGCKINYKKNILDTNNKIEECNSIEQNRLNSIPNNWNNSLDKKPLLKNKNNNLCCGVAENNNIDFHDPDIKNMGYKLFENEINSDLSLDKTDKNINSDNVNIFFYNSPTKNTTKNNDIILNNPLIYKNIYNLNLNKMSESSENEKYPKDDDKNDPESKCKKGKNKKANKSRKNKSRKKSKVKRK